MMMRELVRRGLTACIPESVRIGYKRWRRKDVVRDGNWLFRRADIHVKDNRLIGQRVTDTNLKSWMILPVDTWKREREEEKLLQRYDFSFESMLIIKNPFGRTPLSALILFHTGQKYIVRYTVKDKNEECAFSYMSKRAVHNQRIPVFGLYEKFENHVLIELLDEEGNTAMKREVIIRTGSLPEKFSGMVTPIRTSGDTAMPFVFVTGGINGVTYAFDKNGDIRYYLSRTPRQYGIYPMPDGRFLFPERNVNRPTYINPHANIVYDMDYLGRVRETYYVPDGIHHWAEALPGTRGRRILAAGSSLKDRMEDLVLEYDRNTGEVIQGVDLGELFPEKFQKRYDWAHLNRICCCSQNQILVSLRNLHTVAKIDIQKKEFVWILAHPDLYEGTVLADKVLRPQGEAFHHFFQQHAVELVDTSREGDGVKVGSELEVILFDNHCVTKTKAPWFDHKQESYVCFYKIDEQKMTVETNRVFSCDLSPTRSNAWFDKKRRRVFAMAGASCAVEEDAKAVICEWDFDSREEISRYEIKDGFFKAYPFEIQDKDLGEYLNITKDFRKGELEPPVLCLEKREESRMPERQMEQILNFAYMDDLILVRAQDHKLEKVYLSGEKTWVKEFTDTFQKSEVFAAKFYYVAVPVRELPPGRYKISVQYEGKTYATEKWFELGFEK